MYTVEKIAPDVKRVLGGCDDATVLNRVNAAVEILSAESNYDTTVGWVDIQVNTRTFALPDDVETILAINLGKNPAQGHDHYFQHHLNGPGIGDAPEEDPVSTSEYDWFDGRLHPTIQDPPEPFAIVAFLDSALDNNAEVRIYGYDENDRWITTVEDGVSVDGFLVPTSYGVEVPNPAAPLVKRITRVSKEVTKGFVRLTSLAGPGETGYLLGDYRPWETEPQYRRVRISRDCEWVRVTYKKKFFELVRMSDLIPLPTPRAVVLMVQALKKFDEDRVEEGQKYWAMAVTLLNKKQLSLSPPSGPSIQYADRNLIVDKDDRLD